mgnify:CR=1 FL=1
MKSLRQLLAGPAPLLLLDAASARVQLGWFGRDGSVRWHASEDEAGVALFRGIEALDVAPAEARAFAFCEGPGSVLGIRTAAMALRVWHALAPRPCFAYGSLAVVAHALGRPECSVIADARRGAWHVYSTGEGLRRVPAAALAGPAVTPDGFRHWDALPAGTTRTSYDLAELLPRCADVPLFRATDAPDAFLHEAPAYASWTPQVHRAPVRP